MLSTKRCDSKERRFLRTPILTKRSITDRTTLEAQVHSKEERRSRRPLTDTRPTKANQRPPSRSTQSTLTTASRITGSLQALMQVVG